MFTLENSAGRQWHHQDLVQAGGAKELRKISSRARHANIN